MSRETYADWLARNMQERGLTVRGLAKTLNPESPEIARRSLRRYLKGQVPIERTRRDVASAIGSEETGPDDSEDD